MRDYDYEIDGDDDSQTYGGEVNDQVAFLDYGHGGLWVIGIMNPHVNGPERIVDVLDEDSDINTLVKRAVHDWGVDPRELWVSPCAKEVATLTLTTGRRI